MSWVAGLGGFEISVPLAAMAVLGFEAFPRAALSALSLFGACAIGAWTLVELWSGIGWPGLDPWANAASLRAAARLTALYGALGAAPCVHMLRRRE